MPEINLLHTYPSSKRNISARHAAQKSQAKTASRFDREYFDGTREQGYGGYRYDGRWMPVAKTFTDHWNLKPGDRVIDIGCAKGFLMKDLLDTCPGLDVSGVDISQYAVDNSHPEVENRIKKGNALKLPYQTAEFDFAISINTIHNLDRQGCIQALREMKRVATRGWYVQVDSYRSPEEKELFEKWVLTAKTHLWPEGWRAVFDEAGYDGDYYWTFVE